jgi:Fic family protein
MATIRKRRIGNKDYFYLEHTYKIGKKVKKEEKYLGQKVPKNIEELKQNFFHSIFKERWFKSLETIKSNFNKDFKAMPKSAKEKFIENFMVKFTYETNKIEGSTLSLKETANLLEKGISPKKPIEDVKETEAHKKVFYEMLNCKKDLSLSLVLYWHRLLFKDTKPDIAGIIRKHSVAVARSKTEFPFHAELETLLREFFKWYKRDKDKLNPVELAALVHLKFVSIHPFSDGNGRISRLIMNFVLNKSNYPMLNIHYTNRDSYYTALERSQVNKKDYIFVQYLIKRYIKEYKKYL